MYFEDFDMADAQERNGDDVFSKPVRAGKRTYFFDVKATKNNDYYLTITEGRLLCTVEQARAMRYRASRLINRTQVYFYIQYWLKFRQYDVINHKRTLLFNN